MLVYINLPTPLCREGHSAGLGLLLEGGGAGLCDATDANGWTLLRTAAWSGQDTCVAQLIARGAQVGRSFPPINLELELSTGNFTMTGQGPF